DIVDEGGAGGGAVALPQLDAVAAIVGIEEQGAADVRQTVGVGAGGAGKDVIDQGSAGGGAVALPQLDAVAAVVGMKEQGVADVRQVGLEVVRAGLQGTLGTGEDVVDEDGAGRGAVALPQLVAVAAVVRHEEQGAAHVRQVARIGAGGTGLD